MTDTSVFLKQVAQFCCNGSLGFEPSDITFVMPNKRSAMFLKKYVRECMGSVAMMPRFMTVRTFLSLFSERPEGESMALLFSLYDAYRNVLGRLGRGASTREFDSFVFWGDMMLSDFDDIDKSLVDAAELFKNIKDIKEIQADFLDERQKEVVRRIWGESRLTTQIEQFWIHLADGNTKEGMGAKFLYLWEILSDIYAEFNRLIKKAGISTVGLQYRNGVDAIKKLSADELSADSHFAFVGFNDLSTAEALIFDRMKDLHTASFFWDTAPLTLFGKDTDMPTPLKRLKNLVKHFPMPEGFELKPNPQRPQVEVFSVPSNAGQAKVIDRILRDWLEKGYFEKGNPINTAIVIPDQSLLLPTLLSIPEEVESVNITMGLPYRTTTFATLLHSIISMQLRARRIHGIYHFYFEDVVSVLQHPHIQMVAHEDADKLVKHISDGHVYNLPATDIASIVPALAKIFVPLHELDNAHETAEYLDNLLVWLGNKLALCNPDAESYEVNAIEFFRQEIKHLVELVDEHSVEMSDRTFLHLFEKLFNSRPLALSGKPLQGLQVLGVLETRTLDFDNVIILSMNDGVFPRKQYAKTMIPNNLRCGYGLPDFDSLEWTYAYCFYRLVARAKNVALLYDSRTEGKGKGERSRYITQLKHLMPGVDVAERQINYGAEPSELHTFCVEKTPAVMAELRQFMPGGRLHVSAAALKEYLKCPFSFYLKYVRSMRGNDEMVDYLTSADYGTLVHNTIQSLFEPYENQVIDRAVYDRWLEPDNTLIEDTATEELIKIRNNPKESTKADLNAEGTIAVQAITTIVRADLEAERDKYCPGSSTFTFDENEKKVSTIKKGTEWKIDDELSINFYMSIDRVDKIDNDTLRFIDFKTGNEDTSFKEIDSLLSRTSFSKQGAFQLLTYCEAYLSLVDESKDIVPYIHPMRVLAKKLPLPDMKWGNTPIDSYKAIRNDFRPRLHALLHEIFDARGSFGQCEKDDSCEYCNFASLCGRIKSSN